jgi:hypothetical protein
LKEKALLDPLPSVYANAWHLGLGKISTCWSTSYGPEGNFRGVEGPEGEQWEYHFARFDLDWWWHDKATGKAYLVDTVRFEVPFESFAIAGEGECVKFDTDEKFAQYWNGTWEVLPYSPLTCEPRRGGHSNKPLEERGYHNKGTTLEKQFAKALEFLDGKPLGTTMGKGECDKEGNKVWLPGAVPRGLPGQVFPEEENSWVCEMKSVNPSALKENGASGSLNLPLAVEETLASLRQQTDEAIAPPANTNGSLNTANEEVQAAATRVNGARALVDDYVELALPRKMEEDAKLRAFVLGSEHLPDNSPEDFKIYARFKEATEQAQTELKEAAEHKPLKPKPNPIGPGGPLEEEMRGNTEKLAERFAKDLAASGGGGTKPSQIEVDPLVSATEARLELGEFLLQGNVLEGKPENTALPEVHGSTRVGSTLTCTQGEWRSGTAPGFTYEWVREGIREGKAVHEVIPSHGATHVVEAADVGLSLSCVVVATNAEGSTPASSKTVPIPATAEVGVVVSQAIGGGGFTTEEVNGKALPLTITYHVEVRNTGNEPVALDTVVDPNCTGIQGPKQATLKADEAALEYTCEHVAAGFYGSYTDQATVEATPEVGATFSTTSNKVVVVLEGKPEDIALPQVQGITRIGSTLSCTQGEWRALPAASFTYEWLREGVREGKVVHEVIAHGVTHVVEAADVGLSLTCVVVATNREGTTSATSKGISIPTTTELGVVLSQAIGGGGFTTEELSGKAPLTIKYQVEVRNPGNEQVTLGNLVDPNCAQISGPAKPILKPNESAPAEYICEHAAVGVYGPYTNQATVEATPAVGAPFATASNKVVTEVISPAPLLGNEKQVTVSQRTASVSGTVNPQGNTVTECAFEWGKAGENYPHSAPCEQLPGAGGEPVTVSARLTNLLPGTQYLARLSATSAAGTAHGHGFTVTTLEGLAPAVEDRPAQAVGQNSVKLEANINPEGGEISACRFEVGTFTVTAGVYAPTGPTNTVGCSGSIVGSQADSYLATSALVTGLHPGTLYWARAAAVSPSGTGSGYLQPGSFPGGPQPGDTTFTTLAAAAPLIVGAIAVEEPGPTSVKLSQTVNPRGGELTECAFEWGTTKTSLKNKTKCGTLPTFEERVSALLTGLTAATTYYARISVTNASGTATGTEVKEFRTPASPAAVIAPGTAGFGPTAGDATPTTPGTANGAGPSAGGTAHAPAGGSAAGAIAGLASRGLKASPSGAVTVKLSCPGGQSSCAGTLTLRTLTPVALASAHSASGRIVTLAVGRFAVAHGHAVLVRLHLSRAARLLLAREHVLRVRATMVTRSAAGRRQTLHARGTLRLARARH